MLSSSLHQFLSKGSEGMHLTLSKTEDQGAAVSSQPNADGDVPPRVVRSARHQWFLMLDFR